jgi:hypothetical protein
MKEVKMRVTPDVSARMIQDYLFSLGYGWYGTLKDYHHEDALYFFGNYDKCITYMHNDTEYFDEYEAEEIFLPESLTTQTVKDYNVAELNKPVVSDGSSSSYYTFTISNKAGESIVVETGDVIRCMVGDNFSLGNTVKACRRMWEESQGRGKAGGSLAYDANKNDYFSKEFAFWYKDNK